MFNQYSKYEFSQLSSQTDIFSFKNLLEVKSRRPKESSEENIDYATDGGLKIPQPAIIESFRKGL